VTDADRRWLIGYSNVARAIGRGEMGHQWLGPFVQEVRRWGFGTDLWRGHVDAVLDALGC